MVLIVTPKNKQQEKVIKAFLNSLEIGFCSAAEDAALYNAMQQGSRTTLLNKAQKTFFLQHLMQAK